ncbi:MAG: glycosyltransferase [Caldilineaceae bacterium]
MNILFVSRWFPWPVTNGSKVRVFNLLRGLAKEHKITLLSFADCADANPQIPELQALCHAIHVVPWQSYDPETLRAQLGFLQMTPRSVIDTFSPLMARRIKELLTGEAIDLVIASQLDAASYGPYFHGTPALYEEVEIGAIYDRFAQARSTVQRLRNGLTWFKHRHYLSRQLRYFRACTVASSRERELVAQTVPTYSAVEVVPNCINTVEYQSTETVVPNTLIFTGSFGYQANYDAMCWFLEAVYPQVLTAIPDVQLTITGEHHLPLPTMANVTLTGFVDNIRPLVARSRLSLAPLQVAGTRLKILEAMALGTPVVATAKGAEGLNVVSGQELFVADTAEDFAAAIIQLCRKSRLRHLLAANARQVVVDQYDWSTTMPRFLRLVETVAAATQ